MKRLLIFILLLIFLLVSLPLLLKLNELFAIFDFTPPEQGIELFDNPLPIPHNQDIKKYDFNNSRDTLIYVTNPDTAVGSIHEYNLKTGQDKEIITRKGGNPDILVTNSPNSYYLYFSHVDGSRILKVENHNVLDEYLIRGVESSSDDGMDCKQLFLEAKKIQKLPTEFGVYYLVSLDYSLKIAKKSTSACEKIFESITRVPIEEISLKINESSSFSSLNVNQNMVFSSKIEQFKMIENPYMLPNCKWPSPGFGLNQCYSYDIYFQNKHLKMGRFFMGGSIRTKSGYVTTFDNRLLALYRGIVYILF